MKRINPLITIVLILILTLIRIGTKFFISKIVIYNQLIHLLY